MEWIYKYFSFTAVIAGLGFLIKYSIQRKVDTYFNAELENHKQELNKKLEDHKKELAVMTEKAKYDISRKLFDFEAYAIKKHTIYPELYKRVFENLNEVFLFIQKLDKLIEVDKNQHDKIRILERLGEDEMTESLELFRKFNDTFKYFQ